MADIQGPFDSSRSSEQISPTAQSARRKALIPQILWVLGTAICIWILAAYQQGEPWLISTPIWELQDSAALVTFLLTSVLSAVAMLGLYLALGLALGVSNESVKVGRIRQLFSGLIFVIATTVIATKLRDPDHANLLDFILPIGLGLVGMLCTITARTKLGILWRLGGVVLITMVAAVALIIALVQPQPMNLKTPEVTSSERVRITNLFRGKDPRTMSNGPRANVRLNEEDVNLLLAWGLSLGSEQRAINVDIEDGNALLLASIGIPVFGSTQYLNVETSGSIDVWQGTLNVDLDYASCGGITVPGWLLRLGLPQILAKVNADTRAAQVLRSIESVELSDNSMLASYGQLKFDGSLRDDLFGSIGLSADVAAALNDQLNSISQYATEIPHYADAFKHQVRHAFSLARTRATRPGGDYVLENKAAVIALSIMFGHPRLAKVVTELRGTQLPGLSKEAHPLLMQRKDLAQHFFTSAGLAVLSNESLGLDIGQLKEEMDAQRAGGSGFSFADLAADMAGVRLAVKATEGPLSAISLQTALTSIDSAAEVMPAITDLPEGLTLAQLTTKYGGATGDGYAQLVKTIDDRIAALKVYQR